MWAPRESALAVELQFSMQPSSCDGGLKFAIVENDRKVIVVTGGDKELDGQSAYILRLGISTSRVVDKNKDTAEETAKLGKLRGKRCSRLFLVNVSDRGRSS